LPVAVSLAFSMASMREQRVSPSLMSGTLVVTSNARGQGGRLAQGQEQG
jgi:hypothetical protein